MGHPVNHSKNLSVSKLLSACILPGKLFYNEKFKFEVESQKFSGGFVAPYSEDIFVEIGGGFIIIYIEKSHYLQKIHRVFKLLAASVYYRKNGKSRAFK